jgi:hypothetical protein
MLLSLLVLSLATVWHLTPALTDLGSQWQQAADATQSLAEFGWRGALATIGIGVIGLVTVTSGLLARATGSILVARLKGTTRGPGA